MGERPDQWTALCVCLLYGELSIDNNPAENALRRIGLGCKNWLFCGSDNGGRTAAILFTRIASYPAHRLAELLPNRWQPLP